MATVAVTHSGLAGHLGPASRLSAVLVGQGHTVLAWAPEEYRHQTESASASFHAYDPAPVSGIGGGLPGFAAMLAEATEHHLEELISQLMAEAADLVIHDCCAPWGRLAAEFLGLPRVVSHPLFPPNRRSFTAVRLKGLLPVDPVKAIARLDASRAALARKWGVELGDWRTVTLNHGELTVAYTTEQIVGDPAPGPGWRYVGALMEPAPMPQPAPERPLVYAALGTFSNNFGYGLYRAIIDALADEPVDVVISTGRGRVSPAHLEPLPSNVKAREFVDSRELLGRSSVHVTHAGCSSVHESLLAGVPMVCIPQAVDQFSWAERVEQLGAGRIAQATPDAIGGHVRWLLEDDRPRRRAYELGRSLAAYDGAGAVRDVVERALTPATYSAP